MQQVSPDEYIFSARMDLDDINDIMSTNLPTEDADTLGGLVYNLLGRVPLVGDGVDVADLHLTVLDVDGRRIGRVRAQRLKDKPLDIEPQEQAVGVEKKTSRLVNNTTQNPISGSP